MTHPERRSSGDDQFGNVYQLVVSRLFEIGSPSLARFLREDPGASHCLSSLVKGAAKYGYSRYEYLSSVSPLFVSCQDQAGNR